MRRERGRMGLNMMAPREDEREKWMMGLRG